MQHPHQAMIDPRESIDTKSDISGHDVQPGQGQESLGRVTISGPAMVNVILFIYLNNIMFFCHKKFQYF